MENEKVEIFFKSERFSRAFSILGLFEVAFLLMDPIKDFFYESLQNTLFYISKFR
jgi:hypothetical protein